MGIMQRIRKFFNRRNMVQQPAQSVDEFIPTGPITEIKQPQIVQSFAPYKKRIVISGDYDTSLKAKMIIEQTNPYIEVEIAQQNQVVSITEIQPTVTVPFVQQVPVTEKIPDYRGVLIIDGKTYKDFGERLEATLEDEKIKDQSDFYNALQKKGFKFNKDNKTKYQKEIWEWWAGNHDN